MVGPARRAIGVLALAVGVWTASGLARSDADLPSRLSDADFWTLTTEIAEPGGYFRITDNYTSNEGEIGRLFTMLRESRVEGGVYLGVGPEQNLTYIAAVRPAMAFIVDIRRQAMMQHLMFKALFGLSKDRADFLSLLFARPRPLGLDASTPIQKMWEAYFAVASDPDLAAATGARILERLTKTQGFELTEGERGLVGSVYNAFVTFGPAITTRGSMMGRGGSQWTFADLTGWSQDAHGQAQSFLSSEEHFRVVKSLHDRNLIVAVSGDFGGPKALRAIGDYVRGKQGVVRAFYVSNVEQYLFQDGKAGAFYENVAALPLTPASVFIRPYSLRRFGTVDTGLCGIESFLAAASAGRVRTNNEALACPR